MNLRKFNKNLKKEYDDTFLKEEKHKFHFSFKLRYAIMGIALFIFVLFIGQHIGVQIYNSKMEKEFYARLEIEYNDMIQIHSKKELNSIVRRTYTKKSSWLSNIFSIQFISCGSMKNASPSPSDENNANSFDTNIQTVGVDEADTVKSDGTYIYALLEGHLIIYDLTGRVIYSEYNAGDELYIYQDKIISLGDYKVSIYSFQNEILELIEEFQERLVTSRLIEEKLYLVVFSKLNSDMEYDKVYYDGCINPDYAYHIISYNLKTKEKEEVKVINSYGMNLYVSSHHFFLASNNYYLGKCVTIVSIFDYDLNPIGVVKLLGKTLNQFSMDEYDGYFRIVVTDYSKANDELNSISIYDMNTLDKVGYLDQGIGKDRQEVKSVRFSGDICYVVTYLNTDPLYEIDCSNPENPIIVSQYEAPGYSSYLHIFTIQNEEYILGLGYTDAFEHKISIYKNDAYTTQIGKDLIMTNFYPFADKNNVYYIVENLSYSVFTNHKALFIYNDATYFYFGTMVSDTQYTIFKVDVNSNEVITVYKEIKKLYGATDSRGFLIDGIFYIPTFNGLYMESWSE